MRASGVIDGAQCGPSFRIADVFFVGPSGMSVGELTLMCHDRATASRASRATRGAFGAPGPRVTLVA